MSIGAYRTTVHHVRRVLGLCKALVNTVPTRDDGPLGAAIKLAAMVETVALHLEDERSAVDAFLDRLGLEARTSRRFVDLFFTTPLEDLFTVTRAPITPEQTIVKAVHPSFGLLCFVEERWGRLVVRESRFRHSPGLDFNALLDELWRSFDGRIAIGYHGGTTELAFTPFPASREPIFGSATQRVEGFVAKHLRYRADRIARTYLFVGEPGIGKSTQMLRIAEALGRRTLRIEATTVSRFEHEELSFLLDALEPHVVIVDDVDKAELAASVFHEGRSPATLLALLEWVKLEHPQVTLLMAANDARLPEPMLRPGRVDEILLYREVGDDDRRAILRGHIEIEVPEDRRPTPAQLRSIVRASKGLSGAWLRELALQLRYESPKQVAVMAKDMRAVQAGDLKRHKRRRRRIKRVGGKARAKARGRPAKGARSNSGAH